ncbi:Probable protein phosphatase 2C 65 [Linum grandiflorum]
MGACCSTEIHFGSAAADDATDHKDYEVESDEDDNVIVGDYGARIRLHGASKYISMFSQQGKKGVNQDAMTVWEFCRNPDSDQEMVDMQEFAGDKGMTFCGVFDGHGPYGHKVARHVRDNLASKISSGIKSSQLTSNLDGDAGSDHESIKPNDAKSSLILSAWESCLMNCFKEMDEELSLDASIDSYCSGATAVSVIKKGRHLLIANLGDSRAVLAKKGNRNQLIPVQLTVDLKPNVQSEAERIKGKNGRVFAMEEEPHIFRIWMPDEDCPGLAMARAFGDFCLKDYGLISTPQVSYRNLTNDDEFIVLATDGIWDVLTNDEVVNIVASARKRSMAAKLLVKYAVRIWRTRHPNCRIDDCAVVCLFLKSKTMLTRSFSQVSRVSANHTELAENFSEVSRASVHHSEIAAVPMKPRPATGGRPPAGPDNNGSAGSGMGRADSFASSSPGNVLSQRRSMKSTTSEQPVEA